jgi:hypothetical protein
MHRKMNDLLAYKLYKKEKNPISWGGEKKDLKN